MIDFLRFARDLVTDLLRSRLSLVGENALLRQQLIVAERKTVGRPRWKPWERHAMALAARFTPEIARGLLVDRSVAGSSSAAAPPLGPSPGSLACFSSARFSCPLGARFSPRTEAMLFSSNERRPIRGDGLS